MSLLPLLTIRLDTVQNMLENSLTHADPRLECYSISQSQLSNSKEMRETDQSLSAYKSAHESMQHASALVFERNILTRILTQLKKLPESI
mmetsp:Transcript_20949/g.21063  ORF Transcript_20949/g.21063 Transcript_20949/m.21063 type:complete len:90 (+) Transcript_20949:129-398(+)